MNVSGSPDSAVLPRALDLLASLGYGPDLVERDYRVWMGAETSRADAVLFSRYLPKDISTSAIVLEVSVEGAGLETRHRAAVLARELAAPLIAIANGTSLELSLLSISGDVVKVVDLAYADSAWAASLAGRFGPRAVLEAKTSPTQPALFPIDVRLLEQARTRTSERLTPRIEAALSEAHQYLSGTRSWATAQGREDRAAARLVAGALTALVMKDKEKLGSLEPGALVDALMQRHPDQYRWVADLPPSDYDAYTGIVAGLGADIDFQALDPATLSEVYESALISDANRRESGTHYTPPEMARRILAELPVEELEPGSRSVADPACGSGGLLLAAHDRLRALQPLDWDPVLSHRVLAEQLHGYDTDPFAVEIARLSMLLHAAPAGNGWDIKHEDALGTAAIMAKPPSIIVANPPWKNVSGGGRRSEVADRFVEWAVRNVAPQGQIALVLPASWLDRPSNRRVRAELRSRTDIFETWRLPKGIFHGANAGCCVLFARARTSGSRSAGPILARRVISLSETSDFWEARGESESFIASPKQVALSGTLSIAPTTAWFGERPLRQLRDMAAVVVGPQPRSSLKRDTERGNCSYLNLARDLEPLREIERSKLVRATFPEDFQSARGAAGLGRRKVVIPAVSGPDTPWRLRAGLDLEGILVRNSMQMVIPHDDSMAMLHGIVALLSSTFASCWIDELALERNISTRDVGSIPVPATRMAWKGLAGLGRRLVRATARESGNHEDLLIATLRELDELVWNSLDIPDWIRKRHTKRVGGRPSPEGVTRYEAVPRPTVERVGEKMASFGSVLGMNEIGQIRVYVNGLTPEEGSWIEPPASMPGGLCRVGATFDATVVGGILSAGHFSYQHMSSLSLDDLARTLDTRVGVDRSRPSR